MKLALVISSLAAGGAERVMSQLANFWAARGETVTLITLATPESDAYALDARVRRVALDMRSDSRTLSRALTNNLRRVRSLRRAIAGSGAPVVLSFEDRTNVLALIAVAGLNVRSVISERIDPTRHSIGRAWSGLRRLTYPLADALVVQTQALLPWARRVMRGGTVEVIPNPLREMAPCKADADTRSDTIVAMGRLTPQKGYDILIRAFARVSADWPAWDLVIIGDGEERESLHALVRELDLEQRVSLRGWTAEPRDVLCSASIFVMSSRYEGFPNAMLEAMACGMTVISTDWAGSEELLTHGLDGLRVAVGDVDGLADALRRVLGDPQLRYGLARRAGAVRERFEIGRIVAKWDAALGGPSG